MGKLYKLAGGIPGGADTQIQFNDDKRFGGSSAFTYDKTSLAGLALATETVLKGPDDDGLLSVTRLVLPQGDALKVYRPNLGTTLRLYGGSPDAPASWFTPGTQAQTGIRLYVLKDAGGGSFEEFGTGDILSEIDETSAYELMVGYPYVNGYSRLRFNNTNGAFGVTIAEMLSPLGPVGAARGGLTLQNSASDLTVIRQMWLRMSEEPDDWMLSFVGTIDHQFGTPFEYLRFKNEGQLWLPAHGAPTLTLANGDLWNDGTSLNFRSGDNTNRLLMADDLPFVSDEIVGDGTPQVAPHSLGNVPARVRVFPVKWSAGSACDYSYSSDGTNVTVTMTTGVTYIVMAWLTLPPHPPTP